MQKKVDHFTHSSIVRNWRAKEAKTVYKMDGELGPWTKLKSPAEGYEVSVTFSRYIDHPELVRVRATNWKCEYEPNGLYFAKDAEAFYRTLKCAGFVPAEN